MQPLDAKLQRGMNQQFMVDFNYNSNHLEGNALTYGQTKLLLLFGDTTGNAPMQDYEEMKAHNVGLELMKIAATDKERVLSENFIRELNHTILVRDFYKTSQAGDFRYKINVGVYKTRPNSVITPSGELFDYASPEETPSLMADLIAWYRHEEQKKNLTVVELAALFHYRYIRIHPFEDGNGRIARLLVNYILLRNHYPMIVIRTDDRVNYLKSLHQCDVLSGKIPSDGAHATLAQSQPLIDYISDVVEKKLIAVLQLAKGEIKELVEATDDTKRVTERATERVTENQYIIINEIIKNERITSKELSEIVGISAISIRDNLAKLKARKIIKRIGGDRGGSWKIIKKVAV